MSIGVGALPLLGAWPVVPMCACLSMMLVKAGSWTWPSCLMSVQYASRHELQSRLSTTGFKGLWQCVQLVKVGSPCRIV